MVMKNESTQPKKRVIAINVPEEMHRAFKARAAEVGRKMSEVVLELIEKWLREQEEKHGCGRGYNSPTTC